MSTRKRIQNRPELGRDTLVILNDAEIQLAHLIADSRYAKNRKEGVFDNKQDKKRTSIEIDRDGVESELAFFKLIGKYPEPIFDISIKSKEKGTDDGDALIDNMAIDIKSTRYKTGRLVQSGSLTKLSVPSVDLFCLMIKEGENSYRLKGFYPAKMLLREENYGKHFPGRPCFMVEQTDLMEYGDCVKKVLDMRK